MTPEYDNSDVTPEEMIAMANRAFDDSDNAGPIPDASILNREDRKAS
jgi:hypothetical protein